MYFTFMDGETLGVYRDGKIEKYESSYVKKHRESALRSVKSREWRRESELQFSDDPFATYMEDTAVRWKCSRFCRSGKIRSCTP